MEPALSSRPPNIVIIGAGIGGLALAIALLRQNIPYTLYESASEYSTVGAGVGLGPNALRAMDMINSRFKSLYDAVATGNQSPDKKHVIFDVRLCEPGLGVDRGWKGEGVGHECYTRTSAHRKDLLDIMAGLIPRNTVKFGKKVADMKQIGSSVAIVFSDGEIVEASAVIGCDGVKGVTREAVLGPKYPEKVAPTYSGRYVYRAIVPMKEAEGLLGELAGDGQCFMGKGRNFLCYPISGGREFNVVAFVHKDWNHEDMTRLVSREEMLGDFEGCDERLLKLLDWAKPLQWSLWHHLTTPTYYNGHIALLGDSAHATTPHQAAGAGQCLEDALILSRLLGRISPQSSQLPSHQNNNQPKPKTDLERAFQVYDAIRRPRAQKVVRTSDEAGMIYALSHPEYGEDMGRVVKDLNKRFEWIWNHDLEGDVRLADKELAAGKAGKR